MRQGSVVTTMPLFIPSDGEPRIEGTNLTVKEVVSLVDENQSPEAVADELDITINEVKETLDYATSRRRQVIKERGQELEGMLSDRGVTTEDIVDSIRADRGRDVNESI